MTGNRVAFVSHHHPDRPSGGAVYATGVLALLRAVWGEDAVIAAHPGRDVPEPGRLGAVLRGILGRVPSKAVYARRSGLAEALRTTPGVTDAGIVCLSGPDCAGLLDGAIRPDARIILVCHNIEADLFDAQIARLPGPARALMRLSGDGTRYRRLEEAVFERAALVLAISDEDAAAVAARHPGTPVLHLPPVFPGPPPAPPAPPPVPLGRSAPLRLGFLGKMSWWPNRDAVDWLVGEILDPMPAGRELHLFGLGSERWHDPSVGVHGHGLVPDIAEVWRGMDLMLCPVRTGGGVNIKFAEALHNGLPVLATPFSARGLSIGTTDHPGLRFAADAARWRVILAGGEAEGLAAERPGEALRGRFAMAPQAARLRAAARAAGLIA